MPRVLKSRCAGGCGTASQPVGAAPERGISLELLQVACCGPRNRGRPDQHGGATAAGAIGGSRACCLRGRTTPASGTAVMTITWRERQHSGLEGDCVCLTSVSLQSTAFTVRKLSFHLPCTKECCWHALGAEQRSCSCCCSRHAHHSSPSSCWVLVRCTRCRWTGRCTGGRGSCPCRSSRQR